MGLLTIGGNDIGFANVVTKCLMGRCDEPADQKCILADARAQQTMMTVSYRRILDAMNTPEFIRARGGRLAPLAVSPYPKLLPTQPKGQCSEGFFSGEYNRAHAAVSWMFGVFGGKLPDAPFGFSPSEVGFGNHLIEALNQSASAAVDDLAGKDYPIAMASSVGDFPQPRHTICDEDSWFEGKPGGRSGPQDFRWNGRAFGAENALTMQELAHPNEAGCRAWAEELAAWSQSEWHADWMLIRSGLSTDPKPGFATA